MRKATYLTEDYKGVPFLKCRPNELQKIYDMLKSGKTHDSFVKCGIEIVESTDGCGFVNALKGRIMFNQPPQQMEANPKPLLFILDEESQNKKIKEIFLLVLFNNFKTKGSYKDAILPKCIMDESITKQGIYVGSYTQIKTQIIHLNLDKKSFAVSFINAPGSEKDDKSKKRSREEQEKEKDQEQDQEKEKEKEKEVVVEHQNPVTKKAKVDECSSSYIESSQESVDDDFQLITYKNKEKMYYGGNNDSKVNEEVKSYFIKIFKAITSDFFLEDIKSSKELKNIFNNLKQNSLYSFIIANRKNLYCLMQIHLDQVSLFVLPAEVEDQLRFYLLPPPQGLDTILAAGLAHIIPDFSPSIVYNDEPQDYKELYYLSSSDDKESPMTCVEIN